jgi:hypothetical protein
MSGGTDDHEASPQDRETKIETPPQIIITVLPDQNLDININGVTPVTIIGAARILENMGLGMIQAAQTAGLVSAPASALDHLGKGGKLRPS